MAILEEDREDDPTLTPERIRMVRDSLARSLASIGDQLFWLGLRPALIMATCLLGLYGGSWSVLAVFAFFAVGQFYLRWRFLARGYSLGMDVVDDLADRRWHLAIAWSTRSGMVLTGAVAGCYLVLLNRLGGQGDGGLLLAGAAVGMGLPLICRRRPPGEVLVLLGLALAVVLAFALPAPRS